MDKIPVLRTWLISQYGSNLRFATLYGSSVHGTHGPESDLDIIIVVESTIETTLNDNGETTTKHHVDFGRIDISTYSEPKFREGVVSHDAQILEAVFIPSPYIIFGDQHLYRTLFVCYPPFIRTSFGEICRQTWNRGVKKLTLETDPRQIYVGKKSLYHALRYFVLARQLHQTGAIHFEDPELTEIKSLYLSYRDADLTELVENGKLKDKYTQIYKIADQKFRQIPNEEQYSQQQKQQRKMKIKTSKKLDS